ncbi:MAG: 50S ribosomal protein L29 [Candidatus Babeliales bacterium]
MSKMREELKNMSDVQLKEKIEDLKREYFSLRLNASTAHIKDYSQFKKLRKNIARIFTQLNSKSRD